VAASEPAQHELFALKALDVLRTASARARGAAAGPRFGPTRPGKRHPVRALCSAREGIVRMSR
jgi:hypothetical protein